MKNYICKLPPVLFFFLFLFNLISLLFNPAAFADQAASATIPPHSTNFQFSLSTPNGSAIQHDTQQLYKITYGAYKSAGLSTAETITADWSDALDPEGGQLFTYIDGSASNAYSGAQPVIDLINHTITWMIPVFPFNLTDQTVSFELQSIGAYTQEIPVNFSVSATMKNQYLTMPEQTAYQTYEETIPMTPAAKPTSTPEITVTPTSTPTTPSRVTNIAFTGVSDSSSKIKINTSTPSKISVAYGTYPTALSQTVTTDRFQTASSVKLTGLTADTDYYFRVITTDRFGHTYASELFTFQTAKQSLTQPLDNNVIVFATNGNVLLSSIQKQASNTPPSIILTENSSYQISYSLAKPFSVRSIEAIVRSNVLGANTFSQTQSPSEYVIPMQQEAPSLYIANLQAIAPGSYAILIRVTDSSGNIIEQKVANLHVVLHLTVSDQATNNALSDARIALYSYDTKSHSYQLINNDLLEDNTNPIFTNQQGHIAINLPPGQYRATVSAFLYDIKTVDFTLGSGADQGYPQIALKKDPSNLISLVTFSQSYLTDTTAKVTTGIRSLASSTRLFHLFAVSTTGSFVGLGFLLFSLRSSVGISSLPVFLAFSLDLLLKKHKKKYIFGRVSNEENLPLSNVRIDVEDAQTQTILLHTITNKLGNFYFTNQFQNAVHIIIGKEGYTRTSLLLQEAEIIPDTGLRVTLTKGSPHHKSVFSLFISGGERIFGMLFEVILIISLILEIGYLLLYGVGGDMAFIVLSFLNICLWLFYLHQKKIGSYQ